MALPSLAGHDALVAWVGQPIPAGDPRAGAVLSAASAIVRRYTGQTFLDEAGAPDAPDDVVAVVVQVAARVWNNPSTLESASVDDATRRWGSSGSLGLHLTDPEKDLLGAYVKGSTSGLGTIPITASGLTGSNTVYVPTGPAPSGYPFPWYAGDDLP